MAVIIDEGSDEVLLIGVLLMWLLWYCIHYNVEHLGPPEMIDVAKFVFYTLRHHESLLAEHFQEKHTYTWMTLERTRFFLFGVLLDLGILNLYS